MSYARIRLDLTKTDFPLLTNLKGRTVAAATSEEYYQAAENKIGVIFAENVLPMKEGLQSIRYTRSVAPLAIPPGSYLALLPYAYNDPPLDSDPYSAWDTYILNTPYSQYGLSFKRILEIRVSNAEVAYIGATLVGQLFLLRGANPIWKQITNEGWHLNSQTGPAAIDELTTATLLVNNTTQTYICLPRYGIFLVNLDIPKLTRVSFRTGSNIVQENVQGICSAYNYLILHDGNQLQWSSAFDPLDFNITKAQETGTGFGVPIGLQGKIIAVLPNPEGFKVYSENNIINAAWSSNILFPWVFTPIANSAGIDSPRNVVVAQENVSYVMTIHGLQQVTHNNAQHIFPEITDFLQYRTIESYDYINNAIIKVEGDISYGIFYVGNRYLIFSYKPTGTDFYTHAFVYDSTLQRWGKLKVDHVDAIAYRLIDFPYPKAALSFLKPDGELVSINTTLELCIVPPINILSQPRFFLSPCGTNTWIGDTVQSGSSKSIRVRSNLDTHIDLLEQVNNSFPLGIQTVTLEFEIMAVNAATFTVFQTELNFGLDTILIASDTIDVTSAQSIYTYDIPIAPSRSMLTASFWDIRTFVTGNLVSDTLGFKLLSVKVK